AFGQFGFYDAVDFDPKRAPGGHPQIVRSYMAHHQGMGLLAIDNFLSQDVMVRRFHGSPGVESWALLLDEKIPEGAIPPRAEESLDEPTNEERQEMPHLPEWQPDARPAQAWALGNGNLTSIVTLSGNRGLRHGELMMTRWDLDPTSERHGSRVYIRDQEDG